MLVRMNIWNKFKELKLSEQIAMVATFLAMVSVFLPWYSDTDQFKIGTTFLGITGPLYLAGLLVLLGNATCFTAIVMRMRGGVIPVKENYLFVGAGIMNLFMAIMASSVYFHPKFGINITNKSSGIGLIMVAILGGLLVASGFMLARARARRSATLELHAEHLADMNIMDREKTGLTPTMTIEEAEKLAAVQQTNNHQ